MKRVVKATDAQDETNCRTRIVQFRNSVDRALLTAGARSAWWSDDDVRGRQYGLLFGVLTSVDAGVAPILSSIALNWTDRWVDQEDMTPARARLFAYETVRLLPPSSLVHRLAAKPIRIGSNDIAAGTSIWLWLSSGNLDESVFGQADAFRLDHDRRRMLSFGAGDHSCAFAPVILSMGAVLVEKLAGRRTRLERVSEPEWKSDSYGDRIRSCQFRFDVTSAHARRSD